MVSIADRVKIGAITAGSLVQTPRVSTAQLWNAHHAVIITLSEAYTMLSLPVAVLHERSCFPFKTSEICL
jgi:hypothetical protein